MNRNIKVLVGISRLLLIMHFKDNCILRSPNILDFLINFNNPKLPHVFQRSSFVQNFKTSFQLILQILNKWLQFQNEGYSL
jgi:hypothetical protein